MGGFKMRRHSAWVVILVCQHGKSGEKGERERERETVARRRESSCIQ